MNTDSGDNKLLKISQDNHYAGYFKILQINSNTYEPKNKSEIDELYNWLKCYYERNSHLADEDCSNVIKSKVNENHVLDENCSDLVINSVEMASNFAEDWKRHKFPNDTKNFNESIISEKNARLGPANKFPKPAKATSNNRLRSNRIEKSAPNDPKIKHRTRLKKNNTLLRQNQGTNLLSNKIENDYEKESEQGEYNMEERRIESDYEEDEVAELMSDIDQNNQVLVIDQHQMIIEITGIVEGDGNEPDPEIDENYQQVMREYSNFQGPSFSRNNFLGNEVIREGQRWYEYTMLRSFNYRKPVYDWVFDSGGNHLFVGTHKGRQFDFNADMNKKVNSINVFSSKIHRMAISQEKILFAADFHGNQAKINTKTGSILKTLDNGHERINALEITSDDNHLFTAGKGNLIIKWSFNKEFTKQIKTYQITKSEVTSLRATSDIKYLLVGFKRGFIGKLNLETEEWSCQQYSLKEDIVELALSTDDRQLFMADEDGFIARYEIDDFSEPIFHQNYGQGLSCMVLHSNNLNLVIVVNKELKIVNASNGRITKDFGHIHLQEVTSMVLFANRNSQFTVGQDGCMNEFCLRSRKSKKKHNDVFKVKNLTSITCIK